MVRPMLGMVVVSSADIPEDVRFLVHHLVDELVRLRVHAEIVNHEPGAPQHHDAQVLADVVQVALHRTHHDRAYGLDPRLREYGLDVGHARLHCPRRHQHLGHEDYVVPELDAHHRHPCDEAVVHDDVRGKPVLQRLLRQPIDLHVLPGDELVGDFLHHWVGLVPQRADVPLLVGGSRRRPVPIPVPREPRA